MARKAKSKAGEVVATLRPQPITPPTKKLVFYLVDNGGTVTLTARDEGGGTWDVVSIDKYGRLYRHEFLDGDEIGLMVENEGGFEGRIVLTNEGV